MNRDQLKELEADLWAAADKAAPIPTSRPASSTPVLGLIFLSSPTTGIASTKADHRAGVQEAEGHAGRGSETRYRHRKNAASTEPQARYDYLLNLPEQENIARPSARRWPASRTPSPSCWACCRRRSTTASPAAQEPAHPEGPAQAVLRHPGRCLGRCVRPDLRILPGQLRAQRGQGGSEFFTPRSVVKLMTEIIEPHGGKVFDPPAAPAACSCSRPSSSHQHQADKARPGRVRLRHREDAGDGQARQMNLAVNNLRGDIKQANTYYEDPSRLRRLRLRDGQPAVQRGRRDARRRGRTAASTPTAYRATRPRPRCGRQRQQGKSRRDHCPTATTSGSTSSPTSLKPGGRATLVMANSASDTRHSEWPTSAARSSGKPHLRHAHAAVQPILHRHPCRPRCGFFDKGKTDDQCCSSTPATSSRRWTAPTAS